MLSIFVLYAHVAEGARKLSGALFFYNNTNLIPEGFTLNTYRLPTSPLLIPSYGGEDFNVGSGGVINIQFIALADVD